MKRGFTLIELLIVVAIIGVLATLLMSNFVGVRQRGRDAERKSDLRRIQSALEMYRADIGSYPVALPSCGSSLASGDITYMQKVPCDPLNSGSFVFTYTSDGSVYSLVSCLENVNDSQKDSTTNPQCDGINSWSFTLQNP